MYRLKDRPAMWSDFAMGDRVRHFGGMGDGTVVSTSDEIVMVQFDRHKSPGLYDANWFRVHHDALRKIDPS